MPLSLAIQPYKSEPDTRTGSKPNNIQGTLTAQSLAPGVTYDIYRWDTTEEAFTYSDQYKIDTFTAQKDVHVYKDPKPFASNSATYYRVVKASGSNVVV